MQAPFITTFHGVDRSDTLDAVIRARFDRLIKYCPSIVGGRVLVEREARHHRDGNRFHVRIAVMLPGEDIVIEHEASLQPSARAKETAKTHKRDDLDRAHKYAGVAVREAFEAARRRLQDRARRPKVVS
jgi:hypothetical protein